MAVATCRAVDRSHDATGDRQSIIILWITAPTGCLLPVVGRIKFGSNDGLYTNVPIFHFGILRGM